MTATASSDTKSSARHTIGSGVKRAARLTYGATLATVHFRSELPYVLNRRGLIGCGVEVGVKEGRFSEQLLDAWNGRHLISVDPWLEASSDEYDDTSNVEQMTHEDFYKATCDRLARFGERSSVWRMKGEEASPKIPHHSLDFVYLDARHDYDSVKQDIGDWADRVRPGGILGGHDYLDGYIDQGDFGVKSAVDEFAAAHGLKVHTTPGDAPWTSWLVEL